MKMNKTQKIGALAMAVACAACVDAMGANTVIRDFLDDTISLIPNKLDVSLFEKISYTDNVKRSHSDKIDSVHFDTGASIDAYRTKGDISYGVNGEISYDYYTKRSSDMNKWNWNISPFVKGAMLYDVHNLRIAINTTGDIEPLSNSDRRYVRHYTASAIASYDYTRHEPWGIMANVSYKYDYYPQDDFEDYNKQTYGASVAPYYKFNDQLKTGLRARFEQVDYESSNVQNDSFKQTYNVFADYRMNSFMEMYGEAGIEKKSYAGRARGTREDRDWNYDFLAALRWRPTIRTKIELRSELDVEDTTSGKSRGAAYDWDNSLSAVYDPNSKYSFTTKVGTEIQDEKNNDDDTTAYYFEVSGTYKITDNLKARLAYKYEKVDFKYAGNSDYAENEITLGVSYKF